MPQDISNFAKNGLEGKVQSVRVNAGAFTASQTKDVAIAWPQPFGDTNYTANTNALRQIVGSPTVNGFTVRVAAGTTGYADGVLFVHAIGIHD